MLCTSFCTVYNLSFASFSPSRCQNVRSFSVHWRVCQIRCGLALARVQGFPYFYCRALFCFLSAVLVRPWRSLFLSLFLACCPLGRLCEHQVAWVTDDLFLALTKTMNEMAHFSLLAVAAKCIHLYPGLLALLFTAFMTDRHH